MRWFGNRNKELENHESSEVMPKNQILQMPPESVGPESRKKLNKPDNNASGSSDTGDPDIGQRERIREPGTTELKSERNSPENKTDPYKAFRNNIRFEAPQQHLRENTSPPNNKETEKGEEGFER